MTHPVPNSEYKNLLFSLRSPLLVADQFIDSEWFDDSPISVTPSPVPAPFLVGVETNPGPPKVKGGVPSTTVIVRPAGGTAVRAQPKKKKNKKNKQKKNKKNPRMVGLGPATRQYVETLDNPFAAAPVRLGFNTYLPTSLLTSSTQGFFTSTVNGLAFMITTSNYGCFYSTTSDPTASPAWVKTSSADYAYVSEQFDMARIVSCGFRIFPLVAADALPGVIMTTQIGRPNVATPLFSVPINTFNLSNTTFLHPSGAAFEMLWRPTDSKDYEFSHSFLDDPVAVVAGNYMLLSLQGYPSGTRFYVEHICNYEAYKTSFNGFTIATPQPLERDAMSNTVADEGASSESLFQRIMPYLSNNAGAIRDYLVDVAFTAADAYSKRRSIVPPRQLRLM